MGTLWFGGTIHTLDDERICDALFVDNGIIKDLGNEKTLRKKYQDVRYREVDLRGNFMYPGFVDSHLHLIGHGEKLLRLDLSAMTSAEAILSALQKRVEGAQPGEWIIADGWNENLLQDKKIFNRYELDGLSLNNPMILTRVCRHALIANSKALELAGINEKTKDPDGGIIVKDHHGIPTGYLLDQAQEMVKQVIPEVSEQYLQKALKTSVKDCLKHGLVGAHSEDLNYYGGYKRTFQAFLKVINGNTVKFRTNLLVHHEVVDEMDKDGGAFSKTYNHMIEIGAMKIFADGALGGRTALLSVPYNDEQTTRGVAIFSRDDLKALIKKARSYSMPVAIHAIGDLAFEYAIEAISAYPPPPGLRDRLIHAQVLRADLIKRAKILPIILDIQPRFVASDFPWVINRIGKENMKYCYAWKTLLDEGLHCAGGSDAPIEPIDPLLGIHAAVTRKNPVHGNDKGVMLDEKLSVYEAVKLFTTGSAYAIHKENTRGLIKVGYVADFTILDKDLFEIEPDEIIEAKVMMTVVDDTVMYE